MTRAAGSAPARPVGPVHPHGAPQRREPVDRRLFGFAAGVWLASLAALRVTSTVAWVGAFAAGGAVLLVVGVHQARPRGQSVQARPRGRGVEARPRGQSVQARPRGRGLHAGAPYRGRHLRPTGVWVLAGVLLGVACGFAATAARTAARDAPVLTAWVHERPTVRARLVVTGDPQLLRDAGASGPATVLVPASLTRVERTGGALALDVRVLVLADDLAWRDLLPTQVVAARGRLAPARAGDLTAAVLSTDGPPEPLGSPQWTQSAAGSLRAGLRTATASLPTEPGGLLPGLAIGDTTRLEPALEADFRTTGLTHLTAVSGANITIVVGFVLLLARWLRAGPWPATALAAVALVGFVILVRPSPSVLRAAAMGAVGLLALALGRPRVATAALATAVIASLLFDPALAVSAGFLLSVLATGALVLLAPRWRDRLRAAGVPAGLAEALAVPAAAQVACAPVIAALSGQVSLVALPANLFAAPAVAPATVLGVAAAAVSPLWPDAAGVLAWVGSWPARWLVLVAHTGASVPSGALGWARGWPGALSLVAVTAGFWLAARHPVSRRLALVLVLAGAVGALPVRWLAAGWPPAGAVVVVCDVGQGDAIALPAGDGTAVVVDTGPDPVPVDACLRRLGVGAVELVVISHFHADHVAGLPGVVRGRSIGGFAVPSFAEPAEGAALVRTTAAGAGLATTEVGPGWTFHAGDVDLSVVGPVHTLVGTHSDPNNNSLVLLARVRGTSILLPGDAEVEEQVDLLRSVGPQLLHVDVLKVPHHGSSYQDSELLDATGARIALVSVGADNPYGHPNLALLKHLADDGMRVLRTDRQGDLAVVVTADGLGVVTSRPG